MYLSVKKKISTVFINSFFLQIEDSTVFSFDKFYCFIASKCCALFSIKSFAHTKSDIFLSLSREKNNTQIQYLLFPVNPKNGFVKRLFGYFLARQGSRPFNLQKNEGRDWTECRCCGFLCLGRTSPFSLFNCLSQKFLRRKKLPTLLVYL